MKMTSIRSALFLSVFTAFFMLFPPVVSRVAAGQKTPAEIAKKAESAVVLLEVFDKEGNSLGQGSGFMVAPNGVVVTAYHVIEGAHAGTVKFKDGQIFKKIDVVAADETHDLAVIKIEIFSKKIVSLGDSDDLNKGDRVVAIGNPLGWESTLSDGIVSEIRTEDGKKVIQVSAQISQGSSGGPLFNMDGDVVGVTNSLVLEGQNLNFATPINYARPLIERKEATPLSEFSVAQRLEKMKTAFHPITEFKGPKIKEDALAYNKKIDKLATKMIPVYDKYNAMMENIASYTAEQYSDVLKDEVIPAYVSLIESLSAYRPKTNVVQAIHDNYTEQVSIQYTAALDDFYAQVFGNQYLKNTANDKFNKASELRMLAMDMLNFVLEENGAF